MEHNVRKEAFARACERIIGIERERSGIGTLSEKTLHAVLKHYFEPCTENHEVRVDRFVADIRNESGIIEVQTRSFNTLRSKLEAFLKVSDVTVVYPLAKTKWLCWVNPETAEVSKPRKSPKTGTPYEAFYELYKIKQQLCNPHLSICIVMLELTEYRYLTGWSSDKKRGSTRAERIPNDICEELTLRCAADYLMLVPLDLPAQFTSRDYSSATHLSLHAAQTALNVLSHVGVITAVGKQKNLKVYTKNDFETVESKKI